MSANEVDEWTYGQIMHMITKRASDTVQKQRVFLVQ